MNNWFDLLGVPISFGIDLGVLTEHYRELQHRVHPDRFVNGSDQERRLAVQYAATINEAFATLKDPLSRAQYLLQHPDDLGRPDDDPVQPNDPVHPNDSVHPGAPDHLDVTSKGTEKALDEVFLIEQMELREALEEARYSADPRSALATLKKDIDQLERGIIEELKILFDDLQVTRNNRVTRSVQTAEFDKSLQPARVSVQKLQFIKRVQQDVTELMDELG